MEFTGNSGMTEWNNTIDLVSRAFQNLLATTDDKQAVLSATNAFFAKLQEFIDAGDNITPRGQALFEEARTWVRTQV